jgi:ABC-2 type transport system ATP-binding protein
MNTGYLPSEVFYYDNMKAIDLLKYSQSFYKKDCMDKITKLAERLDLDLTRKIENLSYGNKKKVGIIQGLLHSPKLIILDEPTGGLDPLMQQTFFDIIREENTVGATILFSSHILSEVQKMCTRVAIIKDGTIVKEENINDMRKNNYKKVTIEFEEGKSASEFSIDGETDPYIMGNLRSFVYRGDINALVNKISQYACSDIQISEPDLEEIFMHYYTN